MIEHKLSCFGWKDAPPRFQRLSIPPMLLTPADRLVISGSIGQGAEELLESLLFCKCGF
jgi:hypothetical protein